MPFLGLNSWADVVLVSGLSTGMVFSLAALGESPHGESDHRESVHGKPVHGEPVQNSNRSEGEDRKEGLHV
jgi:hypothetical protein